MRPTLNYVKEKFDYYNKLCFGGNLPVPPIKLNTRYGSMGYTRYSAYLSDDGRVCYTNLSIVISVRLDLPEEEYIDTIVHEMIHYYILVNGLQDDSPHGTLFKAKMKEITEKYGIKITLAFEPKEEELIQTITHTRYVCVAEFEEGDFGVAVVAKNKIFAMWSAFSNFKRVKNVKWYASNRAIFLQFGIAVSPRLYHVEPDKIQHYLTGAVELENTGNFIRAKRK